MSEKRRKTPFTIYEKDFLREILSNVSHIIESKKTDAEFNRKKAEAWRGITEVFNRNPKCNPASPRQLKKLWHNTKSKAREMKIKEKQKWSTEDESHESDMHPEDDTVLELLPDMVPSISMDQDSEAKCDDNGEADNMNWLPLDKMPPEVEVDTTIKTEFIEESETPSASSYKKPLPTVSTVSQLRNTLIKKDIKHQQIKFELEIEYLKKKNEIEMEHLRKKSDMEYKLLLLEYEHKNKLYKLIENEQEFKLQELYYN